MKKPLKKVTPGKGTVKIKKPDAKKTVTTGDTVKIESSPPVDFSKAIPVDKNIPADLLTDFKAMEKNISTFQPDQPADQGTNDLGTAKAEYVEPTMAQAVKIRMFAGFFFYVLSGLETFLLNKIKRTAVPFDKMILDDDEQDSMLPYLQSPEIVDFIDKLPTWLIAVCHYQFMMFEKHSEYANEFKLPPAPPKSALKKI